MRYSQVFLFHIVRLCSFLLLHFLAVAFAFIAFRLSLPQLDAFRASDFVIDLCILASFFNFVFQMSSVGSTFESASAVSATAGFSPSKEQDDYGMHGNQSPGTPTERSIESGLLIPVDLISGPEQAFIAWMKACAPSPEKRADSWWTNMLKVGSSSPSLARSSLSLSLSRSLSLSFLPLSLSLSFSFLFSLSLSLSLPFSPLCLQVFQGCDILAASDLENVCIADFANCEGLTPGMKGFIGTLIKKAAESASDRDVAPGATAAIASSLGLVSAKSESKFVVCVFLPLCYLLCLYFMLLSLRPISRSCLCSQT